jgi:hypothetical protein
LGKRARWAKPVAPAAPRTRRAGAAWFTASQSDKVALELLSAVRAAEIRDAKLRDQAMRAAKNASASTEREKIEVDCCHTKSHRFLPVA